MSAEAVTRRDFYIGITLAIISFLGIYLVGTYALVAALVTSRLDRIDDRLTNIENRLNDIDKRLVRVETHIEYFLRKPMSPEELRPLIGTYLSLHPEIKSPELDIIIKAKEYGLSELPLKETLSWLDLLSIQEEKARASHDMMDLLIIEQLKRELIYRLFIG